MKTKCPVCGSDIQLPKGTVINDSIDCEECGTELEVISVNPPIVSQGFADDEDEDWDD